jgi:hypothetical protein
LSNTRRAIAAGFTPASTALRQISKDFGVMFSSGTTGVGEDREVDVGRDLDRQRHAERLDEVEDISPHAAADSSTQLIDP